MYEWNIFYFFCKGTSTPKRGRKKSKRTPVKKAENESLSVPVELIQTNNEEIEKAQENNSPNDNNVAEPQVCLKLEN